MRTIGITRASIVLPGLGMFLISAAAADGHDLVISARDSDWALLLRADIELLAGFWLLSGRSPRAAAIAVGALFAGVFGSDVARIMGGHHPRPVFGRLNVGPGWVLLCDLLLLACSWPLGVPKVPARSVAHPWLRMAAALVAIALGVAIDRSQVGQFPIITTARSGRSRSGLDYLVYLPDGYYRSFRRRPMILTLHGRGESGLDINLVRSQGLPRRIEQGGRFPFIVVAPQSPDWPWNVEALEILLDEALGRYRIDADRVYLCGNSMGGNGTWELAARRPDRFAAIAPICGRGNPAWAGRLKAVPTWAFHGAADRIVPPEESERMVAALKEAGGEARLTIYPRVGHDAWTPTYADPMFFEWLSRHRRGPGPAGPHSSPRE